MATRVRPALRLATVGDIPLLAAWNGQLIQDERHEHRGSHDELATRMGAWLAGEYTAAIAEIEGEPAAYLLWRPDDGGGVYLRQFFVSRAWRRRGIGRATLDAAAEQLWAGRRIVLDVLIHNDRGRAFWRSVGFGDYSVRLRRAPGGDNG